MPQQRKALRAGELEPRRKELLDPPKAGMVWEPGEEAWEGELAALRSHRRTTGRLAPRRDAVWTDSAGDPADAGSPGLAGGLAAAGA